MPKVLVTRKIPGDHLDKLKEAGFDVEINEFDRSLTSQELIEKIVGVDAVLCLLDDKIDGEIMDAAGPSLRIISNYAVGFDNVDIVEATKRGIVVTNTPSDEVNESVAEHTWALILALTNRIVEADESIRRGAFKGWEPDVFLGVNLVGKTLGIIGLGRIGSMVARRAKGYNMRVVYNKHEPDLDTEKELGVKFLDLDLLLATSDIVSLHVPLTDETRQMINKDTLLKMKKGSFLINTARGPVVNEHDLVEALRNGHLAGAGLDVFENEPNINPELIGMQNVVLTPHIASATHEAREKMGSQAVSAIISALSGQKPENAVNQEALSTIDNMTNLS